MDLFERPLLLLWAVVALAVMAGLEAWADARRGRFLAAFGRPETLSRLTSSDALRRRRWRFLLQAAAVVLCLIALAGPQWGVELIVNESKGVQTLIALDTSLSMNAEDVKPSRIEKAKSAMLELLDGLKGERAGVVVFAGEPYIECPLTTDIDAAKTLLQSVRVGMVPQPGTAIGDTIRLAVRILGKYPGQKALVLLTDGEDRKGDPLSAVRAAAAAGVHIYIIGVGTPDGDPIPIRDAQGHLTGYIKDAQGQTVISKLDESGSIQIAAASSGAYFRAAPEGAEAQEILKQILSLDKSGIRSGSSTRYKNRYRLPLGLALALLLAELLLPERPRRLWDEAPSAKVRAFFGKRRIPIGALPAILTALFLSGCGPGSLAYDLWRGVKDYESGDYGKSFDRFASAQEFRPKDLRPVFNAGDAQYKLEQLDQAKERFSALAQTEKNPKRLRRDSYYNLGDTLFKQKNYKDAAEAYKRCLLLDSSDDDCRFNLVRALAMLKQSRDKKQNQQQKNQPKQNKNQNSGGGSDQQKQKPDRSRPQSEMSQEDAERILQSVREREKGAPLPKPIWQQKATSPTPQGVDW